mgnify:CR=1 FL=1
MVINKFHEIDVNGFTYYIPRDIPENTDLITEIIKTLTPESIRFILSVANHPMCYAVTFLRRPKGNTWYIQKVSSPGNSEFILPLEEARRQQLIMYEPNTLIELHKMYTGM